MSDLNQFARCTDDFFGSLDERAGFPVMFQPVTKFLASSIVSHDIGIATCSMAAAVLARCMTRAK
jgi:hypothetical protein